MVASLDGFLELVWDGSFPLRYRLHVVLHVDVDGIHRGASHTLEHFTMFTGNLFHIFIYLFLSLTSQNDAFLLRV